MMGMVKSSQGSTASMAARIRPRHTDREQDIANLAKQANLLVDSLARGLELLLVVVFGRVEHLTQEAVVQIEHFVQHRGLAFQRQCH